MKYKCTINNRLIESRLLKLSASLFPDAIKDLKDRTKGFFITKDLYYSRGYYGYIYSMSDDDNSSIDGTFIEYKKISATKLINILRARLAKKRA